MFPSAKIKNEQRGVCTEKATLAEAEPEDKARVTRGWGEATPPPGKDTPVRMGNATGRRWTEAEHPTLAVGDCSL